MHLLETWLSHFLSLVTGTFQRFVVVLCGLCPPGVVAKEGFGIEALLGLGKWGLGKHSMGLKLPLP